MQDPYFISTRLLNYQIKHAEKTRTSIKGRPFLVLVLPAVPKEQIHVLENEGATIVHIEPLKLPQGLFDKQFVENSRFRDVLSKLRLWQLVQYEKIVYLDADSFLLENLDGLFLDPKMSDIQKTKLPLGQRNATKKVLLPKQYLMGASADTYGDQTEWEQPGHVNYLCACFMLFAPSLAMFDYYMDVLTSPSDTSPLKNAAYPEQDLLIYVHRQEGPMPYRRIPVSWSANDGEMADELALLGGVKSLHVKGWNGAEGGNVANDKWRGEWRKLVDEMNLYYRVLQMHTVNADERITD
ncbi:nucleotide-diphospho-sugar transferase [Lophiotrema nucula]|uniref:Nucleotide-diphospho-sugar transferase n=1 Tax=Lophiotrema nucula TaxID=690887 RepID=A0A6A5YU55_9PLEO|nr:nucleotide-diphospho-sugar transferase [Lophiotrema nucula]